MKLPLFISVLLVSVLVSTAQIPINQLPTATTYSTNTWIVINDLLSPTHTKKYLITNLVKQSQLSAKSTNYHLAAGTNVVVVTNVVGTNITWTVNANPSSAVWTNAAGITELVPGLGSSVDIGATVDAFWVPDTRDVYVGGHDVAAGEQDTSFLHIYNVDNGAAPVNQSYFQARIKSGASANTSAQIILETLTNGLSSSFNVELVPDTATGRITLVSQGSTMFTVISPSGWGGLAQKVLSDDGTYKDPSVTFTNLAEANVTNSITLNGTTINNWSDLSAYVTNGGSASYTNLYVTNLYAYNAYVTNLFISTNITIDQNITVKGGSTILFTNNTYVTTNSFLYVNSTGAVVSAEITAGDGIVVTAGTNISANLLGAGNVTLTTNTGVITITGTQTNVSGANPTASVGPTAVNGSAATFMRSDGAPAINLTSDYDWTGTHTYSKNVGAILSVGATNYFDCNFASQTNSVAAALAFSFGTNGVTGQSKTVQRHFINSSGSDQTVTWPSGWKTNKVGIIVPAAFTNGTETVITVRFKGDTGSSANQTNVQWISTEFY